MIPEVARVAGTRRETADTWTLELEPPPGRDAWVYRPGQFNMLYVFGIGEVPISISGSMRMVSGSRPTSASSVNGFINQAIAVSVPATSTMPTTAIANTFQYTNACASRRR